MSKMPKMNLWIDAFNSDTSFLSDEELGIYFRLIFFAWARKGYLPNDLEFIVNLTRDKNKNAVNKIIKLYWVKDEKGYSQKRLKEEYERAVRVTESAKKSAEFRWDKNAVNSQSERNASISKSISISKYNINTYFNLFWEKICYKVSKGQARRNYGKLHKDWLEEPQMLADKYNKYYNNLGDKKFAKHPSTWLSAEGWEDETPIEKGFDKAEHEKYKFKQNCEMYKKGIRLQTWSRQDIEKFEHELAKQSN
tara:strand:+ start:8173 stop:8925 length:753 start_codon:yes stop_codon:yes gene_type:complete